MKGFYYKICFIICKYPSKWIFSRKIFSLNHLSLTKIKMKFSSMFYPSEMLNYNAQEYIQILANVVYTNLFLKKRLSVLLVLFL